MDVSTLRLILGIGGMILFILLYWLLFRSKGKTKRLQSIDFQDILTAELTPYELTLISSENAGRGPFPLIRLRMGFQIEGVPNSKRHYRKLTVKDRDGQTRTVWVDIIVPIFGKHRISFKPELDKLTD